MTHLRALCVTVCVCLAVLMSAAAPGERLAANESTLPRSGTFTDVTAAAGLDFVHRNGASPDKYLVETMGSGGLFLDFDNDGWIDIFLVDGGSLADRAAAGQARHRLFRNRSDGTFEDVTARSGIRHREYGLGACAGDVDSDGWVDLYVTNLGSNVLYRNGGDGTFSDVSATSGTASPLWSASCAFADFDRDGDLDLFVTNYVDAGLHKNPTCESHPRLKIRVYCHPLVFDPLPNVLYRNDGRGRFSDVSASAGLSGHLGNGLGVVVFDYDHDGWPDVFVANDGVPNFLFRNDGSGRFVETGLVAGVAVAPDGKARAGMGTDAADYDGDGTLDLVVTNLWAETHSLFRNDGGSLFTYATAQSGIGPATLPFVGFGAAFVDYDNDTRLDLAIVNGDVIDNTAELRPGSTHAQRKLLFHNSGNGRFREIGRTTGAAFTAPTVGRGLAAGDIDNDGDLDLLVTNNGQAPNLLLNHAAGTNGSLLVRLVGTKSNREGIGAVLRLSVGTRVLTRDVKAGSGYLGQNDTRVHFGTGAAQKADRLEVQWPSGRVDRIHNVPLNRLLTVREGEGIIDQHPLRR